jgi:fucose 4-O-acetylase-like acetyltransferase
MVKIKSMNNLRNSVNPPSYEQIETKRYTWVDWGKTLLMFSIVLCHSGISTKSYLWTLIFAFNVPGFFIISGYLYKPHDWKRTLKSFLIPIIFFSILNLGFILAIDYKKGVNLSTIEIAKEIGNSYIFAGTPSHYTLFTGIWFIWVLLLCRLLMGDVKQMTIIRKNSLFSALLLVGVTMLIVDRTTTSVFEEPIPFRVLSCFPFILLGYVTKQLNVLRFLWKPFFIAALFYFAISSRIGFISIWSNDYGGNYLDFFILALMASYVLFFICNKLPNCDFAVIISKGTLLVLGIQPIIIHICGFIFRRIGISANLTPWIISFITLFLCYYPIKFCIKHCPILLGKVNKINSER